MMHYPTPTFVALKVSLIYLLIPHFPSDRFA